MIVNVDVSSKGVDESMLDTVSLTGQAVYSATSKDLAWIWEWGGYEGRRRASTR